MINLSHIKGNGRSVIRYTDTVINAYSNIFDNIMQIPSKEISSSPAITFFEGILKQVYKTTVLTDPALVAYDRHVRLAARNANRLFDTFGSGAALSTNVLVSGKATEYKIPTNGLIGTKVNVLDDWDKWEDIAPVIMVGSDSRELPTAQRATQIVYTKHQPSYCVFCIDTAAILMKFIKYMQYMEQNFDNVDLPDFIVSHIILPMMEESILNTWLQKLIHVNVTMSSDNMLITPVMNTSQLRQSVSTLDDLYTRYIKGNVDFGDIINTDLFFSESVLEYFTSINKYYSVPEGSRYIAADLLKNNMLLEIMATLLSSHLSSKNSGVVRTMQNYYKTISRSRWQSHISNPKVTDRLNAVEIALEIL